MALELFGTPSCPFTAELRAELEWQRRDFVEYDVESDERARARFLELVSPPRGVPVLVDDGEIVQRGWQGRSCAVGAA